MQSNITVVSSVTSDKDILIDDQPKGKAKWVLFSDKEVKSPLWETRKSYERFVDPRRNSRIPKILIHQYVDTEYSIWIDGNIQLLTTPEKLIEKYLANHDIAVFKHTVADCIYDEATKCALMKLDDPETIIEQVKHYEDQGYAKHKGLGECRFIMRRHTPKVEAFNNAWWSEYCRYSRRDQISFPYVAHKLGMRVNYIDMPLVYHYPPGHKLRKENSQFAVRKDIMKLSLHKHMV